MPKRCAKCSAPVASTSGYCVTHRREYMEKYRQRKEKSTPARSEAAQWQADRLLKRKKEYGLLASPAGSEKFDWTVWYKDLYTRLDLEEHLPDVLAELNQRSANHS